MTRYFGGFRPAQTVTQDRKGPESTGQDTLAAPACFFHLHPLTDGIADSVRRIPLHLRRGVGIGAEGKARILKYVYFIKNKC